METTRIVHRIKQGERWVLDKTGLRSAKPCETRARHISRNPRNFEACALSAVVRIRRFKEPRAASRASHPPPIRPKDHRET